MTTNTLNTSISFGITLGTGTYASPFTVTGNGTIDASGSSGIYSATSATIFNHGYVNEYNDGITLTNGGYVSNASTGSLIAGDYGYGIQADGGTLSIVNAGHIVAGYEAVKADDSGVPLTVIIQNSGVIQGGTYNGLGLDFKSAIEVDDAAGGVTIQNSGTIESMETSSIYAIVVTGSALHLQVDPGAVFIGTVAADESFANTLELASGAGTVSGIGTSFTGFQAITLDTGASWLLSGDSAGLAAQQTISDFHAGDTIELTGFTATGNSFSDGVLTLTGAGGPEHITFANSGDFTNLTISTFGGGTELTSDLPCFAAGTRILAESGEVAVEDIRPGDRLVTVRGEVPGTARVIWVGRRSVDITRHPFPAEVLPIRILAGAIGAGVPARDLRVSAHHALYLDGNLFEAAALVNGITIFQEQRTRQVTYHHIELEFHDIVLAEGCAAESYLDTGSRGAFETQGATDLFPMFSQAKAGFCVPLILDGDLLTQVREKIATRARDFANAA